MAATTRGPPISRASIDTNLGLTAGGGRSAGRARERRRCESMQQTWTVLTCARPYSPRYLIDQAASWLGALSRDEVCRMCPTKSDRSVPRHRSAPPPRELPTHAQLWCALYALVLYVVLEFRVWGGAGGLDRVHSRLHPPQTCALPPPGTPNQRIPAHPSAHNTPRLGVFTPAALSSLTRCCAPGWKKKFTEAAKCHLGMAASMKVATVSASQAGSLASLDREDIRAARVLPGAPAR